MSNFSALFSTFTNLSDAICVINSKFELEYANNAFKQQYGLNEHSPHEISIRSLLSGEVVKQATDVFNRKSRDVKTPKFINNANNSFEICTLDNAPHERLIIIEKHIKNEIKKGIERLELTEERIKSTIEHLKFSNQEAEVYHDRFRLVLHNMPVLFMAINAKNKILFWNTECERVTGYKSDEIVNVSNAYKLIFTDSDFSTLVNKSKEDIYRDYPVTLKCKDKSAKRILWSGLSKDYPMPSWDFWMVGINVTDRDTQEEKLIYESNINESLANASAELISPSLSIDKIARVIFKSCIELAGSESGFVSFDDPLSDNILIHYFSEAYFKESSIAGNIFFFPRNEYVNEGFYGYPIDKENPTLGNDQNIISKRKIGSSSPELIQNFLIQPAVANELYMGHVVLINSPNGFSNRQAEFVKALANVYALAVFRKRMEWDMVAAKDKAEESDKLKSAFLANMSHEIRTPMNAIVGFSEMLIGNQIKQEKRNEFYKHIKNSCDDLLMLVNDIIDISKIEAGQLKFHPTKFIVKELLLELKQVGENKTLAKNKNIPVIFDQIDEADFELFADRSRLKQVLMNLIGNAIKFTDVGGINIGFNFDEKDFITFYVKDTGIGIPREEQIHIFESFRQIESTISRNYGGTGLGLSISKSLVEQMGGQLHIDSELSNGSTFWFTLPSYVKKVKSEAQNIEIMQDIQELYLDNKTILVVEDEPRNAKLLTIILTNTHARIINAYNGLEAVEAVKREKPDLILMDIRMPEMDGLEATRIIKTLYSDIPIIAQTAYAMKEDRERCIAAGCVAYISKPIKRNELFSVIKEVV